MTSQLTQHEVRVNGYAAQPARAVVNVDHIPSGRRIRRAVGGFAMWFALALLSVFIPVGHFILVPTFLLASFIVLGQRLGVSAQVVAAHGTCPDCGTEQDFDIHGQWRSPTDTTCRQCQRPLVLTSVEAQGT